MSFRTIVCYACPGSQVCNSYVYEILTKSEGQAMNLQINNWRENSINIIMQSTNYAGMESPPDGIFLSL